MEAKPGVVEGVQAGIDVASADMALTIAFLLLNLSAQYSILFQMKFRVYIRVPAVFKIVTTLTSSIQLPDLDISFN